MADGVARASVRLLECRGRDEIHRGHLIAGTEEVPFNGSKLRVSGTVLDSWSSVAGTTVLVTLTRARSPRSLHDRARHLGLTQRQADVAVLLADRRSNKEIALELAISPHTARHHTENVLLRLGISNRQGVGCLLTELDPG